MHSLLILWLLICFFCGGRLAIAQFADSLAPHLLLHGGRLALAQFADRAFFAYTTSHRYALGKVTVSIKVWFLGNRTVNAHMEAHPPLVIFIL